MGSKLKLPCTRFTRQVSNGISLSKYGYIGMMQQNAEAIKSAAWRKASCRIDDVALTVNKVTQSDGAWDADAGVWSKQPTYTAFLKDNYDCFKQGGDAVKETGTFCGYLGMAAYRFTLPTVNPGAIDELKLMIQRDRYLRSGVRVAIEINSSAVPSDDWSVIRGEKSGMYATPASAASGVTGVASWGFLGQHEVPWLLASRAMDEALTVTADEYAGLADAETCKYLWVYMSIEDMADHWDMYSASEPRYYSIEGSATLISACCEFSFSTDAEAPDFEDEAADEVEWGAVSELFTGNASDNYAGDVEILDTIAQVCCFGKFAFCHGLSVFAGPWGYRENTGTLWDMMARSEGCLLLDAKDRTTGENAVGIGKPDLYLPPSKMFKLGGLPVTAADSGGVFFYLRHKSLGADTPSMKGFSEYAGAQMYMGAIGVQVPTSKSSYTRFRMFAPYLKTAVNCKVSVNVWKSKSLSLGGMFGQVAVQALMADPAFFTGEKKSVSGSATETLWDGYSMDDNGVCTAKGATEEVAITVDADLIATVNVEEGYDFNHSGLDCWAVDVVGVDLKPGDYLIFSPHVDFVHLGPGEEVAYWGLNMTGKIPKEIDVAHQALGAAPYCQFA